MDFLKNKKNNLLINFILCGVCLLSVILLCFLPLVEYTFNYSDRVEFISLSGTGLIFGGRVSASVLTKTLEGQTLSLINGFYNNFNFNIMTFVCLLLILVGVIFAVVSNFVKKLDRVEIKMLSPILMIFGSFLMLVSISEFKENIYLSNNYFYPRYGKETIWMYLFPIIILLSAIGMVFINAVGQKKKENRDKEKEEKIKTIETIVGLVMVLIFVAIFLFVPSIDYRYYSTSSFVKTSLSGLGLIFGGQIDAIQATYKFAEGTVDIVNGYISNIGFNGFNFAALLLVLIGIVVIILTLFVKKISIKYLKMGGIILIFAGGLILMFGSTITSNIIFKANENYEPERFSYNFIPYLSGLGIMISSIFAGYNCLTIDSRKLKYRTEESLIGFFFILMPLIGFMIFTAISMGASIYYSFTNFNPVSGTEDFVWFRNYERVFTDSGFWDCCLNTILLMISIPIGMFIGLLLASYLKQISKGSKALRLIYYLPAVSSAVAINIIWQYLFQMDYGLINNLLDSTLGAFIRAFFDASYKINIPWLGTSNPWLIRIAIIIKNSWGAIGGTMLLYLAGLNGISDSYYEAASVDGATTVQKFFKITVPLIKPTTFYLIITGVIGGLQSYTDSQVFANGNPAARTIVYYIWQYGIGTSDYGLACAVSTILCVVIMIVTFIQFKKTHMLDI